MKHKFLKKLIVASVVTSTIIALNPVGASAAWVKNAYGNWSYTEGYNYATGWRQISGIWYFFDDIGQMRTGWICNSGDWYYMDLSGAMQIGIIQIEGKTYLFNSNGAMQKGNCVISGKVYNIDDNGVFIGNDTPMPIKGFDYNGNITIPYVPSQIISGDASMSSDIPTDGTKQLIQYKVKFKDPDNDDDPILKTRTIDENTKMPLYKPTKSGYTFVEWNTKSDGDGTSYEYDDQITITKDLTLYAQWKKASPSPTDTTTEVTGIKVAGSGSLTTITTQGGTLQMTKTVTPSTATVQTVKWSVVNKGGEAVISSSGLLTAVANGTVTVKATATDGSGVVGTVDVTISGQ